MGNALEDVRRIVLKVGTSTLTYPSGRLDIERIDKLVKHVAMLHNKGYEIILVTSGAIGAGIGTLGLKEKPEDIRKKQALASIGQVSLMHLYAKFFREFHIHVGELLVNKKDLSNDARLENFRGTIEALFEMKTIPIINENDALSTYEIRIGDNDTLSASITCATHADMLILISDVDGLYTKNPFKYDDAQHIAHVQEITHDIEAMGTGSITTQGTGGMETKLAAAKLILEHNKRMIICSGEQLEHIAEIFEGKQIGTLFYKG